MKKSYFAAMLAVGMIMFGAPALSLADEQPAVPADGLDFAGAKKSVKFNHSSHKTVECKTCHHEVEGKQTYAKCASAGCHDDLTGKQPPKALFPIAHSKKKLGHQTCMSCHDSVVAQKSGDEQAALKKELMGCKGSKCHPE